MSASNNSYIFTPTAISVMINGKPYNVSRQHDNYEQVARAIKHGDWDQVPELINIGSTLKKFTNNSDLVVDLEQETITYKGEVIDSTLVRHIICMMKDGFNIDPMTNFLQNLYKNVSKKAIDELYDFLEHGKMPITSDGHFLAYKRVNNDYTSCYDNTTTNNIGEVTSLPRYKVDDRSEITCSYGLHVCSFDYLQHYLGDKVIVVKVNPADVVSIPTDYNNTKARVCRYEVIGELTPEEAGLTAHSFGKSVVDSFPEKEDTKGNVSCCTPDNTTTSSEFDYFHIPTGKNNSAPDDLLQILRQHVAYNNQKELEAKFKVLTKKSDTDSSTKPNNVNQKTSASCAIASLADLFAPNVSKWYKIGYTNGYRHGVSKLPMATPCTTQSDPKLGLQDIADINAGYLLGYPDGKGHKKRKFDITTEVK